MCIDVIFFQNSSQYYGCTAYWDRLFINSVYKNNCFYDKLNWLPLVVNCEYSYLLIVCCFLLSWGIHRSDQQTDTFFYNKCNMKVFHLLAFFFFFNLSLVQWKLWNILHFLFAFQNSIHSLTKLILYFRFLFYRDYIFTSSYY